MFVRKPLKHLLRRNQSGQALAEYALILVMVAILFAVTLAATGPAIGNVFSNAVYNLIGGRPEDIVRLNNPDGGVGRSDSFWATVEWVAMNPPEEAAIPPRDPLPPPPPPTAGPSPTPTPVTPSSTPQPSATIRPTQTPEDMRHIAPWVDKINNPGWYRMDTSVWLGLDQWHGEYYANATLNGNPEWEEWHQGLGLEQNDWFKINFNWPGNSGPREGWLGNNFSAKWTRQIYVEGPDPAQVRFTTTAGGHQTGVRLYVYPRGSGLDGSNCSSVTSGGSPTGSASTYGNGQSPGGASDCLVIDNWSNDGGVLSVSRTLDPGFHIVQMDYFHGSGDSRVNLAMENAAGTHPDNATVPEGGAPVCDWYHSETQRSNSASLMWEEARSGEFPSNTVCYLELRGWVDYAALVPATNPQLVFWDVWDMASANTEVWLEVAEYNPDPEARNWQRIDLRRGTTNYNWTRNVIDLGPYISGFSVPRLTFRFVMRDNGGGGPRRWYVDDIELRNIQSKTFSVCTGSKDTCGSFWNLDNKDRVMGNPSRAAQPPDFLTSGRWELTNERAQGALSWDSGPIVANSESGSDMTNRNQVRINYLEFNGMIDLTANLPDADGDDGAPLLSFYHAYDIGSGTQLELQYSRDPYNIEPDNWETLEVLVPETTGTASQNTLTLQEIDLENITNWDTQPFRLRFAQIVESTASAGDGWWIDTIYIERRGGPRYSDYPFVDTAQGSMDNWLPEGQWSITSDENFTRNLCDECGRSFTDSPNGDYTHNTNASLVLRHPIDLNFDSPENLAPDDDSNIQTAAANRPVLTFWHRRELHQNDNFLVEWSNDAGLTWNTIWQYTYNSSNARQRAWEYIEIDLSDIQANDDPGDPYDDDILIRFRLDARNNSNVRDGLYIDDIHIRDYSENSHRLWATTENHPTYGSGEGTRWVDDFDSPGDYWNRWKLGGWDGTDWTQHSGLISMTESPRQSTGGNQNTRHHTYSVLGMNEIIDLRGVDEADNPTLYFWTRYRTGRDDRIGVEVAVENTGYSPTNGSGVWNAGADYQRVRDWNAWQEVWYEYDRDRNQAWHRAAVDLRPYAGERLKIRFVYNKLNDRDNQDGWYIDDVILELRSNAPEPLPFSDTANSLGNWIVEGTWGLAPDQWRDTGGSGTIDIGNDFWTGVYYDCERHFDLNGCNFNNLLYTNYNAKIERPYNPALDIQEFALEINHNFGSTGRPLGGSNDPTWDDYYAARWKRPFTVTERTTITFITYSDDGVRLRYNGPGAPNNPYWNLIEDWQDQAPSINVKNRTFDPGTYELVLEWYEKTGGAVIILTTGINNFSFGDSPSQSSSPWANKVNSIQYASSSMMMRRPIDLTGTTIPVIQYYTRYDLGGTGRVEVSTDGGFTWTQTGLSNNNNGFQCPSGTSCSPTIDGGNYMPTDPSDWQRRQHNLTSYIDDGLIHIRFRLETQGSVRDGWYVTDIEIAP